MEIKVTSTIRSKEELLNTLWDGGYDVAKKIIDNGEKEGLLSFIKDNFKKGDSKTKLNSLIWFASDKTWANYGIPCFFKNDWIKKDRYFKELIKDLNKDYVSAEIEKPDNRTKSYKKTIDIYSLENNMYMFNCEIEYISKTKKFRLNL